MSSLDEFLERYDAQKREQTADVDVAMEGGVEAWEETGEAMLPLARRMSERAGVPFDQVCAAAIERVQSPTTEAVNAALAGQDLLTVVAYMAASAWADAFLAGVQWEQERNLPDLEPPP